MVEAVSNVLLIVSAVLNLEMIYRYHRLTRGAWRDTQMGRHVMVYMASTALVLSLASARLVVVEWFDQSDPAWFQVARLATYVTIPAIFVWRRHLIVVAHRENKEQ